MIERCWFLCNEHVQTSFLCVFEFFFSHLYGIYLVPINCDSLRLGCGQGHCAMTSLTFLYSMDKATIIGHRSVNNDKHFIVHVEIVVKIVLSKCLEMKLLPNIFFFFFFKSHFLYRIICVKINGFWAVINKTDLGCSSPIILVQVIQRKIKWIYCKSLCDCQALV